MYKIKKHWLGVAKNPFTDLYEDVYDMDKEQRVYVPEEQKRPITYYDKQAICCGNVVEIVKYGMGVFEGFEGVATGKKSTQAKKKDYNIKRSALKLRRLINCNCGENDLFITLTYKDNLEDVKKGKEDFKNFIKRWNYQRKKKKEKPLKYVYVVEFQKRGAVHFHCIFFNVGYIKKKELSELWGLGFVKVNKIDHVDNVGSYVVKYMEKDLVDDRLNNSDLYGRSRGNLDEPVIIKNPQELAILEETLEDKCVYESTYPSDYHLSITYKQYNCTRKKSK